MLCPSSLYQSVSCVLLYILISIIDNASDMIDVVVFVPGAVV